MLRFTEEDARAGGGEILGGTQVQDLVTDSWSTGEREKGSWLELVSTDAALS